MRIQASQQETASHWLIRRMGRSGRGTSFSSGAGYPFHPMDSAEQWSPHPLSGVARVVSLPLLFGLSSGIWQR